MVGLLQRTAGLMLYTEAEYIFWTECKPYIVESTVGGGMMRRR